MKEEIAYIIGLCIADGYLRNNTITLELSEKDIVKKIKDYLGEKANYGYRKRTIKGKEREFYKVSFSYKLITSPSMNPSIFRKGRLGAYDFYKKYIAIDFYLISSFIRGLFDGDGSISHAQNQKGGRVGISINTSQKDVYKIWEKYFELFEFNPSWYFDKRGNGSWYVSLNRQEEVNGFYNMIYSSNPTLKINKKYEKFKTLGFPTQ